MFLLINKSKSHIFVRAILGRMEEEFRWFNPQAAEPHAAARSLTGGGREQGHLGAEMEVA